MKKPSLLFAGTLAAVLAVGGVWSVRGEVSIKGEIEIRLDDSGSSASGAGVDISGDEIAIHSAGVYHLTGALSDGQVQVKVGKKDHVTLILDGVVISNGSGAAIFVKNAGQTILQLAEDSVNRICSGMPVELSANAADDSASGGAIHAKDDLTIEGAGRLTVLGYVNNGIHCSNQLEITGGELTVEAVNNGVKGKDGVTISGGSLSIRSGGDGIDSDADDGRGYGVINIAGGELDIESFGDGMQAATALTVSGGSVNIVSGGGSAAAAPKQSKERWNRDENRDRDDESDAVSSKGLKASTLLTISGGKISIDAADDALHSDGEVSITGGMLTLSTGDDGIHADDSLGISSGLIVIERSYEGLEANQILISGGEIDLNADDDGLNANGGQSFMGRGFRGHGGFGGRDGFGGDWSDAPQTQIESEPLLTLRITGGALHINAEGDGLDSNGDLIVEGGEIVVDGPSRSGNGALDSGSESGGICLVHGGTVLAIGSSGMAETFDEGSEQYSFCYNFSDALAAGSGISVADADGNVLFAHTAAKSFSSVVFSSPDLVPGESYMLTAGDQTAEILLDAVSTQSGERSRWGR